MPLIARWTGVTPPHTTRRDLIDFTDFLPTLADAAGMTLPFAGSLDGRSFLPAIRGETGRARIWVACHYDPNVPFGGFQLHAGRWVRNAQFKLYQDGRFFDMDNDPLEKSPLQSLTSAATSARSQLQAVLGAMPTWIEKGAHHRDSPQNQKYKRESR